MKFHFQNNVIRYPLTNILPVDGKMNQAKKYDVIIKRSEKWNFYKSIPLRYLFSAYHHLPLWHMKNKIVIF